MPDFPYGENEQHFLLLSIGRLNALGLGENTRGMRLKEVFHGLSLTKGSRPANLGRRVGTGKIAYLETPFDRPPVDIAMKKPCVKTIPGTNGINRSHPHSISLYARAIMDN